VNDVNTWGQGVHGLKQEQKQVSNRWCWVYGVVVMTMTGAAGHPHMAHGVWLLPHPLIIMASTTNLDMIAPEPQLLFLLLLLLSF